MSLSIFLRFFCFLLQAQSEYSNYIYFKWSFFSSEERKLSLCPSWSKGFDSSSNVFVRVGSNPTGDKHFAIALVKTKSVFLSLLLVNSQRNSKAKYEIRLLLLLPLESSLEISLFASAVKKYTLLREFHRQNCLD